MDIQPEAVNKTAFDEDLLKIICCPLCHDKIKLVDGGLACTRCRLIFPIRDGIAFLIVEEAITIEHDLTT
ncbi:MAG: Trm112 family protein [Nitrospirae bacterium]|nr:Trm112 family protein [Nitrospirota bacterium]